MRTYHLIIASIITIFNSCRSKDTSDYKFGVKFNSIRKEKGSPLVKHNMVAKYCCDEEAVFEIDKIPADTNAYHSSKTIRLIINGHLAEEKDIYRKILDDTTLLQLNILTRWSLTEGDLTFKSNLGKIDRRILGTKAKDFINNNSNYPDYKFADLSMLQIDSVLAHWNLSRFDAE